MAPHLPLDQAEDQQSQADHGDLGLDAPVGLAGCAALAHAQPASQSTIAAREPPRVHRRRCAPGCVEYRITLVLYSHATATMQAIAAEAMGGYSAVKVDRRSRQLQLGPIERLY